METNNKLREALTKILNLTNSLDENCAVDPVDILDIARAALAEPVKNCEVGTAKEQAARFFALCDSNKCSSCPCRFIKKTDCALIWAQMPYEEGGDK